MDEVVADHVVETEVLPVDGRELREGLVNLAVELFLFKYLVQQSQGCFLVDELQQQLLQLLGHDLYHFVLGALHIVILILLLKGTNCVLQLDSQVLRVLDLPLERVKELLALFLDI